MFATVNDNILTNHSAWSTTSNAQRHSATEIMFHAGGGTVGAGGGVKLTVKRCSAGGCRHSLLVRCHPGQLVSGSQATPLQDGQTTCRT